MTDDGSLRTQYAPGTWMALVGPGIWLLIDVPADDMRVAQLWPLIEAGADVDDILDVLLSAGVRAAPSFALTKVVDGERRVLVRGEAHAQFDTADGPTALTAPPGTWEDRSITGVISEIRLLAPGDIDGPSLPCTTGVTFASVLTITNPGAVKADVAAAVKGAGAPVSDHVSVKGGGRTIAPLKAADTKPERPAAPSEPPMPKPPPASEPAQTKSTAPPAIGISARNELALALVGDDADDEYDNLFQLSGRRPTAEEIADALETAAPTVDDIDADEPELGIAQPTQDVAPLSSHAETPVSDFRSDNLTRSWGDPDDGGILDDLDWTRSTDEADVVPVGADPPTLANRIVSPGQSRPSRAASTDQDVEIKTRQRDELLADLSEPAGGPTVQAVQCPAGHLTSPASPDCRVCGDPVPSQQSFAVTRPSLGRLLLPTGDAIPLDKGVLLGRAPDAHAYDEHERPHVVRLASPDNEMSRNHTEVVLEGWSVLVRDLGSTNGTTLTLPGREEMPLTPHQPYTLEPGSSLELAHEVTIVFEVVA